MLWGSPGQLISDGMLVGNMITDFDLGAMNERVAENRDSAQRWDSGLGLCSASAGGDLCWGFQSHWTSMVEQKLRGSPAHPLDAVARAS